MHRRGNHPDFRHRNSQPNVAIEEIENELHAILTPAAFAPLRKLSDHGDRALRDRKLDLPTMTAVVLSLVLRSVVSQAELLRMLRHEGLLWSAPLDLSKQALSKRFDTMPASIFARLFDEVITYYQHTQPSAAEPALGWWQQQVDKAFTAVWSADTSTLEQLRRTTKSLQSLQQSTHPLAGMIFAVVESFTATPVCVEYRQDQQTDELVFATKLLEILPEQGLVVFDKGFFQFALFDRFTEEQKYFLTRMRTQVRYEVIEVLAATPDYRDEIIVCGFYRSAPSRHRLRLVSVRWGKTWYQYVSNVLDPDRLSAEHLCQLYRSRWRIETAFNEVKRLLGLSYLWSGSSNGVEIQVYATWIIYTVLTHLCVDVARGLGRSIETISFEMVFRGLYHYSRSCSRASGQEVSTFLIENAKSLGIIKEHRNRQRLRDQQWRSIWGYTDA